MTGSAFCKYCNYYNDCMPLTGYREPDGQGGWEWQVAPGIQCQGCGERLVWLHQPAPESLVLSPTAQYRMNPDAASALEKKQCGKESYATCKIEIVVHSFCKMGGSGDRPTGYLRDRGSHRRDLGLHGSGLWL